MRREEIRERIVILLREMNRGAMEREEVIALSLLSALGGESIFLLGLPGVGKSMVARRLKLAFRDSTCFEYLMSRFSTPDEIFGPVSISKLKDSDTYERVIDGYLPTADVVFLDEIWKAGPAIQNSLLTAINEKIYHNGRYDIHIPVKGIIAASNELPAEGEGLEALWDRFLIRYVVPPIKQYSAFVKLISGRTEECSVSDKIKFSAKEYAEIQSFIEDTAVSDFILDLIVRLRTHYIELAEKQKDMDEETIDSAAPYISDRRWKKIVRLLKTSALLNGRDAVNLSDCLLLEHMLWDKDTQIPAISSDIAAFIGKAVLKEDPMPRTAASDTDTERPYSPDGGVHYVIDAGSEQLKILAEDYNKLSMTPVHGQFDGIGNIQLCHEGKGEFRICRIKSGTVSINNFIYPLRMAKEVATIDNLKNFCGENTRKIEFLMEQVNGNIFTREMSDYVKLNEGLRQLRRSNIIKGKR